MLAHNSLLPEFRTDILEKDGSEDAMQMFVHFRGREPSVEPLLERRGLKR